MFKIRVMGRREIEQHIPQVNTVLISIYGMRTPQAEIRLDKYGDVLFLQFDDVGYNEAYAMTRTQAMTIVKFLKRWYNSTDILIVQCEAGISRSAGIAAAISKFFSDDDMWYFSSGRYIPNMHCYGLVYRALIEFISKKEKHEIITRRIG